MLTSVDFSKLTPRKIDPIVAEIDKLEDMACEKMDVDFHKISELANKQGAAIIRDLYGQRAPGTAEMLDKMKNHYDRAMCLFLDHGANTTGLFDECYRIALMRDLPFAQSKQCKGLPRVEPQPAHSVCSALKAALQEFYRPQGRGQLCVVEHYLRTDPVRHCYFAFPEDYPESQLQFNGDKLGSVNRSPVMRVGFIFNPADGLLEIGAEGKKEDIERLQLMFCQIALGMDKLPTRPPGDVYKLGGLLQRDFDFRTEPAHGIESVTVTALRLRRAGGGSRRVTIEQSSYENRHILDLLRAVTSQAAPPAWMDKVDQARLHVTWRPVEGRRPKTLTFTLTCPDSTSLKDMAEHRVIKSYLGKWGLM